MIELICIHEYNDFIAGNIYYAVHKDSWTDEYDTFEEYIFYGNFDYVRDMWEEIRVDKYHFMTPAEWREHQINSILND
jgi:hypothetical protein